MTLVGQIHESQRQREEEIKRVFKNPENPARPAFAVSCHDGILIVTKNSNLMRHKIKKILDGTIAFVGVGNTNHYREIYRSASASMETGRVSRSEHDVIFFNETLEAVSSAVAHRFRNLYSHDYYECEIIFAMLGEKQDQDRVHAIDFTGHDSFSNSWSTIPVAPVAHKFLNDSVKSISINQVFPSVAKELMAEEKSSNVFIEAAILSRSNLLSKSGPIYCRLSQDQIRCML